MPERKRKTPLNAHPIDVAVGNKIREFRAKKKMTQHELADELGLSFQQVQKYEVAGNRISASRLWEISQVLDVSVVDFFIDESISSEIAILSERTLRVAQTLDRLQNAEVRNRIVKLIKTCAEAYT